MPLSRRQRKKLIQQAPQLIVAESGEPVEWVAASLEAAEGDSAPAIPRFKMKAYTGGLMYPKGFYYPVVVDLAGFKVPSQVRAILRDHDTNRIVGHSESIEVSGRNVLAEGPLSGTGEDAEEIRETSQRGFPWQSSLGARVLEGELKFVDAGEKVTVNGQTFTGPCYVARKSVLYEISFVVFGGDDKTSATIKAGTSPDQILAQLESAMNFEQWLKAKGFDPATLTAEGRATLQAMFDREQNTDEDPPAAAGSPPVNPPANPPLQASGAPSGAPPFDPQQVTQQMIQAQRAETARQDQIRTICAAFGSPKFKVNNQTVDLAAHAISEGWTADQTELQARRESRPAAPAGHAHSHEGTATLQAMQGAMLLRAGVALDHAAFRSVQAMSLGAPDWLRAGINDDFRQRTMEAAHRFADLSLVDLCREALRINAMDIPSGRQRMIEAALSSGALTKIFSNNIGAQVLVAFMDAPDTTQGWVLENTNVPNYLLQERSRLQTGNTTLKKHGVGEEAEHGTFSDTGETYRIARYARQLVVDDIDIVNDRFGVLTDTPREMGRASRRLRPDLVYALILINGAMADSVALFHANHNNLLTTSALGETTVKAAIAKMMLQQENGVNLSLTPTHLIVPPTLKYTGLAINKSSETRGSSGGPTSNTLAGAFTQVVSEARLENGLTDPDSGAAAAGSASTWYTANSEYPCIEVGTLRGSGGVPTIRQFLLSEGKFGIGWDCQMSIGAKPIRYQSMTKATA